MPHNLSFDIKQTTQNYTIPHHTITYRMVPFVFWYQTARIWRIWQGPQRPVGILTPSTKYKTTSSTCVSTFGQVEEDKKTFSSASILVQKYVKYVSLRWQLTWNQTRNSNLQHVKKGCQEPFALIHQLIGCCHVHLFIASKTVEIALEKRATHPHNRKASTNDS